MSCSPEAPPRHLGTTLSDWFVTREPCVPRGDARDRGRVNTIRRFRCTRQRFTGKAQSDQC